MNAERFTILARFFTPAVSSRRAALAAVLGGSIGALVLDETEAGNAGKRRKRKLRRQRRFCKEVARRAAIGGADYCRQTYQFSNPAVIPACITSYYACLPYTRACKTQAAKACYAAFHAVW